ncbi:uncharacterized protein LOC109725966 [Ananas comosus]|uniref:Uncharacterized protein LOC109725966 n=1 Tax=Ananas comosus TaxID=4615 RepID=A0A199W048_ANACO|nr:uncharacterized protein LOC109725966 [Ananas comosus]OAY82613.1 hypothetical protein ACMD2_16278 [Ananas comosus]
MSIALERRARIGGSGFAQGLARFPIYDAAAAAAGAPAPPPRRSSPEEEAAAAEWSSSSIGRNSDISAAAEEGEAEGEEAEVQSSYKGPLDALDALEESLPIRRGISKFYCGKSKSFTVLTDAPSSSTSAEGLAKPENAYTRKRKNLLAFSIMCNKPQYEESMTTEGSVAKRAASSSRSPFSPLARSSSGMSSSYSNEEEHEQNLQQLPPLHPNGRASATTTTFASPIASSPSETPSFPLRSFSLNDLRGVVSSSSSIHPRVKHKSD